MAADRYYRKVIPVRKPREFPHYTVSLTIHSLSEHSSLPLYTFTPPYNLIRLSATHPTERISFPSAYPIEHTPSRWTHLILLSAYNHRRLISSPIILLSASHPSERILSYRAHLTPLSACHPYERIPAHKEHFILPHNPYSSGEAPS